MDKTDTKFYDVVVIGKMHYFGASKSLYCIIKYIDIAKLKGEEGESLPVRYVSSYYDYNIGDTVLLVENKDKMSLYNKKGGKKLDVK